MLESWIIDSLRRREEERRRRDRPQLELPVPNSQSSGDSEPGTDQDQQGEHRPERGVVIMEMQGRGKPLTRSRPTQRRRRSVGKADR
jgi:hypothetical protein